MGEFWFLFGSGFITGLVAAVVLYRSWVKDAEEGFWERDPERGPTFEGARLIGNQIDRAKALHPSRYQGEQGELFDGWR